jgi:hypothetical protein
MHGEILRGSWYLECGIGKLRQAPSPVFESLEFALGWIEARLVPHEARAPC